MPSVKIPRKATDTDMTPFVDVAFLILTFFIMATKFKPPEPVEITTPNSVSSEKLPENNAVMITMDKDNRVFFSVLSETDKTKFYDIIRGINSAKNLNLSEAEMQNFRKTTAVGVPFTQLKGLLGTPADQQINIKQGGIPIDTTGGELTYWVQYAKAAFAGQKLVYLIKGDNNSKYPTFDDVITALKRNEQFKYNLITSPEEAPPGTELSKERLKATK